MIRSLLQHSRCETFYLLYTSERDLNEARSRLAWYPNQERERFEPILLDDYHHLRKHDRMILFHPGGSGEDAVRNPALHGLVNLRAFSGRPSWPITGVTHSISGGPGFWFTFEALLRALRKYDSLVCTSEAGRKAIEQMTSRMAFTADQQVGSHIVPELQLPVIPLGTDTNAYQPRDKAAARDRAGLPQEAVIFLYLGRFSTPYKADLFPLILAFSRLDPHKRAKANLILAGDDVPFRMASKFKQFAAALDLRSTLTFCRTRPVTKKAVSTMRLMYSFRPSTAFKRRSARPLSKQWLLGFR